MRGLLAYSGITTKVRAMQSHFITDAAFHDMAALESVSAAVDYLKHLPPYVEIFSDLDDNNLHRGIIEQRLILSKYRDFTKLYRFSNLSQRKFLDLYFMHYETAILKRCFHSALDHHRFDLDLSLFQDFFEKHSKLDLMALSQAENLVDFIACLNGTPYYAISSSLSEIAQPTLFDYELHLDLLYFKTIWKTKDKLLSHREQDILSQCFGSRLDMLNIQWIHRSKKYYHLSPAAIYALLIPVQYRLKKDEIIKLTETATDDEFYTVLRTTFYGSLSPADLNEQTDLEQLCESVLNRIHHLAGRKDPYSIATLNSYLYFKETEIHKIITTIEGLRYGLSADTIYSYVIKN
ncbi:MAG: V-type ATPase subunit [Hungatella sp.]